MMKIGKDDVIIVYHPVTSKRVLGRATKQDGSDVHFFVADETAAYDSSRENHILPITSVFCNLGPEPRCYGKAYGVDLNPFHEKTHVKGWGDVLWMLGTDDDMVNDTEKTLKTLVKYFKEDRIHPFVYVTLIHELEPKPSGKAMRGWYKYIPRKESDKIMYNCNEFSKIDLHVAAHEYGHGCWFRLMSDKMRGKWVEAYADSIDVSTAGGNHVKGVLNDLSALHGRDSLRNLYKDYKKEDAGDLIIVLNTILDIIDDEHYLDRKEIISLLDGGYSIKRYLPSVSDVKKGIPRVLVSEYGMKNAFELWAEAFGFYYSDQELPEHLDALMKETLVTLQSSR
jgi:hypothetical protein